VKRRLKNCISDHADELRHLVNTGFSYLRHRPELELGFFQLAGLAVKQLW
jgi:hypothetical protein